MLTQTAKVYFKLYRKLLNKFGLQRHPLNERMKRPFEIKDLLPVPDSWKVGGPDFIGIASGKAGTSWWYTMLLDHPNVKRNRLASKELSYFQHFTYRGIDSGAIETYRQAFSMPDGCVCGEWSPGYLTFPLAVDYIAKAVPDVKLLAIVRNPIDCLLSTLNQMLSVRARFLNLKGSRAYVFNTFSSFPVAVSSCFLYESFRHLLQLFDSSQLLILQYEQCKTDPASEIAKTYRFLGVDDSYIPANLNQKVNLIPYNLQKLSSDERTMLADYFSEDVHSLIKLFPQIDLSLWADFEI